MKRMYATVEVWSEILWPYFQTEFCKSTNLIECLYWEGKTQWKWNQGRYVCFIARMTGWIIIKLP